MILRSLYKTAHMRTPVLKLMMILPILDYLLHQNIILSNAVITVKCNLLEGERFYSHFTLSMTVKVGNMAKASYQERLPVGIFLMHSTHHCCWYGVS